MKRKDMRKAKRQKRGLIMQRNKHFKHKQPASNIIGTAKVLENVDAANEKGRVLAYFREYVGTMRDCHYFTGIWLPNITRYVCDLKKQGVLFVAAVAPDRRTGRRAQYLTADPAECDATNGKEGALWK
jgi:hypothetical protein